MRLNYKSFKGTSLTAAETNASGYISCWVLFTILADLMVLIGAVYKTFFECGIQCVKVSRRDIVHGSPNRTF